MPCVCTHLCACPNTYPWCGARAQRPHDIVGVRVYTHVRACVCSHGCGVRMTSSVYVSMHMSVHVSAHMCTCPCTCAARFMRSTSSPRTKCMIMHTSMHTSMRIAMFDGDGLGIGQGVVSESVVLFNPEPAPVFCKLPTGKVQRIQVNPAWNIWGLKKEVGLQTKYDDKQIDKIMYNGQVCRLVSKRGSRSCSHSRVSEQSPHTHGRVRIYVRAHTLYTCARAHMHISMAGAARRLPEPARTRLADRRRHDASLHRESGGRWRKEVGADQDDIFVGGLVDES